MTEDDYDSEIAPALLAIAKRIEALGGSMISRVEWEPGECGITQTKMGNKVGAGQKLTKLAAHCNGDIDRLFIHASRHFDMNQTAIGHLILNRDG